MENRYLAGLTANRIGQAVLIMASGFGLIVLVILAIDHQVIRPVFRQLEWKQALEDNERALAGLENEVAGLAQVTNDWANWDDAYAFARNHNPAFIKANYPSPATMSEITGVDLLAFYDRQGVCLLQGAFQPLGGHAVQLKILTGTTPPILALIAPVMDHETPMDGLLATEHGLLLLVARPILTSSKSGPSRGVILMGRFLNETGINALSQRIKGAINLFSRQALPPAEQGFFDQIATLAPDVGGQPVQKGGFVYRMLFDIGKKPLVLLRTPVRGEIAALSQRTGRILTGLLSAIALVLLFCLVLYRDRMKASNKALEVSEARYRQLFDAESDAIFLIDNKSGRILEANNAAVSMYGYDHEDLLTKKNSDLSAEPEETQRVTRESPVIADQIVTIPLRFHRKKDNTVFPVEITGRFFVSMGRPVHIAAVRDITERKRVEDALRFTQFAVDHSADSAFWVTVEGRFVYVNQEGCRSLGYTQEELLEMVVGDINPEFPWDTWAAHWQELKAQQSRLLESTLQAKDGRIFPVEIRENFVAFGGQEYNCAIVRDISRRKQMAKEKAELEALNWQLQKEESLGRMAGAIAHHFNNQLTIIIGFIQLATDEQPVSERASQDLAAALDAANKAADLSSLMLTYLGHTSLARQPMDLAEVCRQCLPMILAILPVDGVLETEFPAPGPMVTLSVEQMQQILTNLIVNSVEAIDPATGRVKVGIRIVLPADIPPMHRFPVGWRPRNQAYACLTVADNGCGIAPADIEKLFDPFFTSKFTGRGLGLPVVLGLIKVHDGAITVESAPGQGSTFRIFLPLSADAPTSPSGDLIEGRKEV